MDPLTISALIAGGSSLLSGGIGSLFASRENNLAFDRQKELQLMQQEYNTSMWNKYNDYNTPSAQLARATAAGINPNQAIASITGASNSTLPATPAVPNVSSTSSPTSVLMQGLSGALGAASQAANIKLMQSSARSQELQNLMAEKDLAAKDDFISLTKESMAAKIRVDLSSSDLSNWQKARLEFELKEMLPVMKEKSELERQELAQRLYRGVMEINNLVISGRLLEEKINTERATQGQIIEQTRGQRFDNVVRQLHASIAEDYGVDISADAMSMLVELSLSGDKGQAALDRAISTLSGIPGTVIKSGYDNIVEPVIDAGVDAARYLYNTAKSFGSSVSRFVNRSGSAIDRGLSSSNSLPRLR